MIKQLVNILLLIFFTSHSFAQTTTAIWKQLSAPEYNISYPDEWENSTSNGNMQFMILSSQVSPEDQFRENINLIIQDLAGHFLTLDEFQEISENQVKTLITNGKIVNSQRLNDKGIPYHQLVFTGDQGMFRLTFEQRYYIKDEKAYVLTFTCEEKEYKNYKETGKPDIK